MEQYLKKRGNYITLRLSNVYGPYQRPENPYCGVVNKFIFNALIGNKSKIYSSVGMTRDYTYVDDVVEAVLKAVEEKALNTEINIGTGQETALHQLIQMIGGDYDLVEGRKIDNISRRCLDISKAKELLKWEPATKIKRGIVKTKKWIKKEYNEANK